MDRASSTPAASRQEYQAYLLQLVVVFLAYFVAGKLGQATTNIRSSNLGPVWPAYGVALAAVLLGGYRIWPALAFASFTVALTSPEWYLTALGQAAGTTLAALTGGFILRRIANFDNSLSRLRDSLALILLGALGSAIVSASIGTLVLHATKIHAYSGLASAWLIYWLGDSTGALLVTPVALTLPNVFKIRDWRRQAEFGCLLLLLVGACTIVFDNLPIIPVRMVAFAVLPLIIWASIRFGVSGAALSLFLVATVATVQTALGSGSFASATPFVNGIQLDGFFLVLSLTGLTFASLYSERDAAEREREQHLRERVAMEVRLQDSELLRDNEERLRLAVKAGRMFAYSWDAASDAIEHSGESAQILGIGKDRTLTGAAMCAMAHPDDRERVEAALGALSVQNPTLQISYQIIRPDGTVLYVEQHIHAYFENNGKLNRMVGMIADVTDRKRGEQEINRKLIEAQEKERSRIGRELHDDINQRLALLTIELGQLQQHPSEVASRTQELRKEVEELSDDVQALSHDLHSSKLEYLGVVAGIKSWCRDFSERQAIEIRIRSDVSSVLPFEVGRTLLRILQEAVNNAIRHGGVKCVDVQLLEKNGEIHLRISDSGRGFNVEDAMKGKGLGLTSMRERARLINGTITIESKAMSGTTIRVRVPLEPEQTSLPDAV